MTNKRNLVMGIFLSLLIITLMTFSLTYARYTDELQSDGEISGDIEYIVSNQIEVDSVNSFISAIENGYTNIKISDDVDNPLIITGGVSDVNSDLTIDLNGHELQRNNRDPVLNVTDGVRLTIKDSKGGGCFYNPVGSALRVSGGTLTVTSGIFESGPRTGHGYTGNNGFIDANNRYAGEYVSTNDGVTGSAAGATIGSAQAVTYYTPNGSGGYSGTPSKMPIITPKVLDTGEETEEGKKRFRINGNMYFENKYSAQIPEDTYLYYTISGANVENTNMAATDKSANFYYTYYVTQNADGTVTYAKTEGTNTLLVTIYGYTGVKKGANDSSNFAAIQMEDGYLDVQGGRYTAYFGKGETNCVYASGGEMTVQNGAFEALRSGVCVRMASQSTSAAAGELAVRSGSFYSEEGDTIFVTGGNMSVTGGTFIKVAETSQTVPGANNAAIHVSGGKLVMTGAGEDNRITFSLTGSHLYGINVEHGEASTLAEGDMAEISYAAFTFEGVGNNNYAINSANAAVSVKNTNFTFGGASTSNRCISVSGGNAKASVSSATFTYNGGSSNYAIVSTEQGEVEGTDLTFEFLKDKNSTSGNENVGIYSSGGVVTLEKGDFMYEGGDNHYAVYSKGGTVTGTDLSFAFNGDGSSNTGIYTTGGKVSLTHGTFNFNKGATEGTSGNKGIHSKGGEVEVTGEENTFIFNADADSSRDNFGIYSEKVSGTAGTITCNNSTFTINGSYSAGILAFGGTVTLGGTFKCTVVDGRTSLEGQTVLSSTAISVEGGTVILEEGSTSTITTNGLGITSLPGEGNANSQINITGSLKLTPLNDNDNNNNDNGTANNDNGTAIYLNGGELNIAAGAKVDITCNLAKSGATALRWAKAPDDTTHDPNVAEIDPNNGIYVNGGSLKSYGTLNVTHTGVQSDIRDDNRSYYTYENQPIKSYAVRVSAQENSSSTSEVVISSGKIKNSIGGGVYVGGGTVTLGTENGAPTIETTGTKVNSTFQWVSGTSNDWTYERWRYGLNLEGGHAVEVDGGNLTVNGGSYSAKQGNGIFVRNTSNNVSGSVVVNAGNFIGYNEGQVTLKNQMLGPAASYGLNVMGGGSVKIYGGTFGILPSEGKGTYSGAAIAGKNSTHRANATIYSGEFYGRNTDAFSVFFYADVSFGGKDENGNNMGDDGSITVYSTGAVAGISIQDGYGEIENQYSTSSLSIYYGSYYTYLYFGHNATLNIYGGKFDVTDATYYSTTQDHIINFGKYATNNKISISGGHFKATSSAFQASDLSYYSHIIASDHNAYDSDGNTVWGIIQSSREPEIWVR